MPHCDDAGGITLFVGDLASFADEQHIEQVFLGYGFEIVDVKLMRGKQSMSSLGYGFVTMRSNNDAMRAIAILDSKLVYGRKLRVKWAVPNMKNKKNSDPVNSVYVKFQALTMEQFVTEEKLRNLFSTFGFVTDVSIKTSNLNRMAGERDSGYGFVHFEEGEEGVAAAFKAIHTITTAVIINDVEYVCEASQNLLRQVQMMNKARGQYIDPSTGDFVRLPRPSTNESTGERYMGGGGNPNFSRDSTIIGSGQGPISSKSQHIEQNRYVNYGNQSAVSDDHYRSQHTSNFPGRSSGGFSGNHDPYYGEASRKSSQSDYPSQSQLSQSRGQSGAQNESTFSGKSMGQFTRPGTAQMRPSPEYYPPSVHTSNSQRPSFSLDASSHSNESPPGYSYPSRSKAVSLNGSPPPPDSVSNKNRQSQFVDLSSFGLDSSTHGSSSTSMQVDISSFMSSLRLSDTESSEQRHVNQPPMMASMNGISSTNPRIATDSDFPSRATQGYTFPSTAARTPFNKGVSTNN